VILRDLSVFQPNIVKNSDFTRSYCGGIKKNSYFCTAKLLLPLRQQKFLRTKLTTKDKIHSND
ncbi:MAG: hypothetical protein K2M67_03890, partial [Muribaculaceae bacterium]|nr:hypothetical protein [Muribaculaceae bacterium]